MSSTSPVGAVEDERLIPPMGMTSEQFRSAADTAISDITSYYDTLDERPVLPSIQPGYLRELLPTSPPQEAEPWADVRADIETKIMPGMTHWQSPDFMAFFPANSTYPGILGELWSAALTVPAFNWLCSPVVTELETVVLDWLAQSLNLPSQYHSRGTGGGVIQGSASEAIVTVMVAARERIVGTMVENEKFSTDEEREDRMYDKRSRLVALGSQQSHSSTQKAANIAGTRYRSIETHRGDNFALRGPALRSEIERCRSKGLEPYYLTVTLGTTNTCAIDDFEEIAAVKRDYPNLWIHVDAAYAGAALVCPEYQHLTKHFTSFDSFDMNMHKWLLTNFDASCLFVQNRRHLTDALSITPAYLRNHFTDSGLVTDYRDWQIPLGRRFRALKIWFTMRTYGVQGFQAHIRHHVKLGNLFTELVRSRSDLFDILVPPAFALTVITVKSKPTSTVDTTTPTGVELEDVNRMTREVYQLIDSRKEIFLTSSVVGGVTAIRVVSCNPLADEKHIRKAFRLLVEAAEEIRDKQS